MNRNGMQCGAWSLPAVLAGLLLAATGCGDTASPPVTAQRDSHQRMLAALRLIQVQTADRHPFLGTRALRAAERELADARPGQANLPQLQGVLGEELLRAGRTEAAIRHLQEAWRLLPPADPSGDRTIHQHVLYRLAVAHLRLAETANCVHCENGESCLLPIRGRGVHGDQAGSRAAMDYLRQVLELNPEHLESIWLLNIAAMTLGTWPAGVEERFRIPEAAFPAEHSAVRPFVNVARDWQLNTINPAGSVILDDFNGDQRIDIVTSTWDTAGQLLYFEQQPDGRFLDVTQRAGLTGLFGGLNLNQADYDNDGDTDILVLRGAWLEAEGRHPNSLLQNDGQGHFRDVTFDVGLAEVDYPTQTAAWADYDNDGDLDLYIGNEGYPCQLFENQAGQKFVDVAQRAGVLNDRYAKGVSWGDFNNDRWPDLYVSNLPDRNRLYRNNGNGTFTDVAEELGVSGPIHSFPVWFFDFDNDGLQDLYVGSFQPGIRFVAADLLGKPLAAEADCLYRGLPDGTFTDIAREAGLTQTTQPMGSNFGDIDNDGFLDFYLGVGYVDYEGLMPNLLFRNVAGQRVENVTYAARMGHLQKGHGIAFADLDADGDQDVFAQMGGWFAGDAFANAVFQNPGASTPNHWIGVRLTGQRSNRSAIGARLKVTMEEAGVERSVFRWVNSGGSFGANPLRQHIGLGAAREVRELEVYWPASDQRQVFHRIPVDQWLDITEGQADFRPLSPGASP